MKISDITEETPPLDSNEDLYVLTDQESEILQSTFNNFKEKFYQQKQLVGQGRLIKALLKTLKDIQSKQENDSADPFQNVEDQMQEQKIAKKDLENIKLDIRSFYQHVLSTKKMLENAGKAAESGKMNFNSLKSDFSKELRIIQDDILEIYNELIKISPLKEVNEQNKTYDDRLAKAKNIQAVYNDILKNVGPIVNVLTTNEDVPEKILAPIVDKAIKRLESIADLFPSVKAFAGQVGEFSELQSAYIKAIRNMSSLNDNFQSLLKDESQSFVVVNNLYRGLQKFSSEIEGLFGIESKIENKPAPEIAVVEPVEDGETQKPESELPEASYDIPEDQKKAMKKRYLRSPDRPKDVDGFFTPNLPKFIKFLGDLKFNMDEAKKNKKKKTHRSPEVIIPIMARKFEFDKNRALKRYKAHSDKNILKVFFKMYSGGALELFKPVWNSIEKTEILNNKENTAEALANKLKPIIRELIRGKNG